MTQKTKTMVLQGKAVAYQLRSSAKARHIRITVYPAGTVSVTLPWQASEEKAERFLRKKGAWVLKSLKRLSGLPKPLVPLLGKKDFHRNKEKARALVGKKLLEFNKLYGFAYRQVAIRNQKSRWGSCSKAGNLNFNYKIIYLPEALADYLIVHELCHLKEFNHSARFWGLVEKAVPDFKKLRAQLRRNCLDAEREGGARNTAGRNGYGE
jgi:predicted metal-dependent hydrolase